MRHTYVDAQQTSVACSTNCQSARDPWLTQRAWPTVQLEPHLVAAINDAIILKLETAAESRKICLGELRFLRQRITREKEREGERVGALQGDIRAAAAAHPVQPSLVPLVPHSLLSSDWLTEPCSVSSSCRSLLMASVHYLVMFAMKFNYSYLFFPPLPSPSCCVLWFSTSSTTTKNVKHKNCEMCKKKRN